MNILWPDIHKNLTKNIAKALYKLNHTLILPSNEYVPTNLPPKQFNQWAWNTTWTQEKADITCSFPRNTFKDIESNRLIPNEDQKQRILQNFSIQLKIDTIGA